MEIPNQNSQYTQLEIFHILFVAGPECTDLPHPEHGMMLISVQHNNEKYILKASCMAGYKYTGSEQHVCVGNNKWNGTSGECVGKIMLPL